MPLHLTAGNRLTDAGRDNRPIVSPSNRTLSKVPMARLRNCWQVCTADSKPARALARLPHRKRAYKLTSEPARALAGLHIRQRAWPLQETDTCSAITSRSESSNKTRSGAIGDRTLNAGYPDAPVLVNSAQMLTLSSSASSASST